MYFWKKPPLSCLSKRWLSTASLPAPISKRPAGLPQFLPPKSCPSILKRILYVQAPRKFKTVLHVGEVAKSYPTYFVSSWQSDKSAYYRHKWRTGKRQKFGKFSRWLNPLHGAEPHFPDPSAVAAGDLALLAKVGASSLLPASGSQDFWRQLCERLRELRDVVDVHDLVVALQALVTAEVRHTDLLKLLSREICDDMYKLTLQEVGTVIHAYGFFKCFSADLCEAATARALEILRDNNGGADNHGGERTLYGLRLLLLGFKELGICKEELYEPTVLSLLNSAYPPASLDLGNICDIVDCLRVGRRYVASFGPRLKEFIEAAQVAADLSTRATANAAQVARGFAALCDLAQAVDQPVSWHAARLWLIALDSRLHGYGDSLVSKYEVAKFTTAGCAREAEASVVARSEENQKTTKKKTPGRRHRIRDSGGEVTSAAGRARLHAEAEEEVKEKPNPESEKMGGKAKSCEVEAEGQDDQGIMTTSTPVGRESTSTNGSNLASAVQFLCPPLDGRRLKVKRTASPHSAISHGASPRRQSIRNVYRHFSPSVNLQRDRLCNSLVEVACALSTWRKYQTSSTDPSRSAEGRDEAEAKENAIWETCVDGINRLGLAGVGSDRLLELAETMATLQDKRMSPLIAAECVRKFVNFTPNQVYRLQQAMTAAGIKDPYLRHCFKIFSADLRFSKRRATLAKSSCHNS